MWRAPDAVTRPASMSLCRVQPGETGAGVRRFSAPDAADSVGLDQPLRKGGQPEAVRADAGG